MIVVTPKTDLTKTAPMYGSMSGVAVQLFLKQGQKWTATKHAGYWWLRRKGSGVRLRLTDPALDEFFKVVNSNV